MRVRSRGLSWLKYRGNFHVGVDETIRNYEEWRKILKGIPIFIKLKLHLFEFFSNVVLTPLCNFRYTL